MKKMSGLTQYNIEGIHDNFEVVTGFGFVADNVPIKPVTQENRQQFKSIMKTMFDEDAVKYCYYLENHKINFELATNLGLGVLKSKDTEELFLYHSDVSSDEEVAAEDEFLRICIYYQLTHPDFEDVELEKFYQTEYGENYIGMLCMGKATEIVESLGAIFKAQKAGDKVVWFKK
ncbi:hypothetical protein [Evansella tamaricis]|uniref:Uncharacterized protein n=1 Tax=Evansella tamaricis TaxID=2069301 RepID=A0ABS6JFQ8_9BACI|nr:hypothetical protein [Evansella tamaricis]MBU9711652.1 hypothetical protein [Evansella tamaricis]